MKTKNPLKVSLVLIAAAALFIGTTATAQPIQEVKMSMQGILKNFDGTIVTNGYYDVTFKLYTQTTGGTAIWSEDQTIQTNGGVYNTVLGKTSSGLSALQALSYSAPYYLGITISGSQEMNPRMELTGGPISIRAKLADEATHAVNADYSTNAGHANKSDTASVAQIAMALSSSGAQSFSNDVWNISNDGKKRLYFGTNSTTYFGSQSGYVFRNSGDTIDLVTIQKGGDVFTEPYTYGRVPALCINGNNSNVSSDSWEGGPHLDLHNSNTTDANWAGLTFSSNDGAGYNFAAAGIKTIFTNRGSGTWMKGDLAFFNNNLNGLVENVRITSAGNVGIGTTTPTHKLHVNGGGIRIATIDSHLEFDYSSRYITTTASPEVGTDAWMVFSNSQLGNATGAFSFRNQNDHLFTIKVLSGNVGVSTTTPAYKLDVNGDARANSLIINGSGSLTDGTIYSDANWGMYFRPRVAGGIAAFNFTNFGGGTSIMTLLNSGNLGLGTTTPDSKLTVVGSDATADGKDATIQLSNTAPGGGSWYWRAGATGTNTPAGGISLANNAAYVLGINSSGNVAIGTTLSYTQAKLVVGGSATNSLGTVGYLTTTGAGGNGNSSNVAYSIYASNNMAAADYHAFSDQRIKNIAGISNSQNDLKTLMGIQITDYTLIDKIEKGNAKYKKVIAQQVEKVYPQAVSISTDVVPDIYKLAEINAGRITVSNNLKAGEKVKLIFENKTELVEVMSADEKGFNVNVPNNGKVFVYGREVNDFRSVDYEAISMLGISAIQELNKIIETQKTEINSLKSDNATLKSSNADYENRLKKIESYLQMSGKK